MTAKEYLQSAYRLSRTIEQRKEIAESHRNNLYGAGIQYDRCGSRNSSDSLGKAIADIEAYERQTDSMIVQLAALRFCIQKDISAIDDSRQRDVLINRYLLYMNWKSRFDRDTGQRLSVGICEKMKYSEEAVYKFHREALKKITVPENFTVKYSEIQKFF